MQIHLKTAVTDESDNLSIVKFCDSTTAEQRFEGTTYGGLIARETFRTLAALIKK